MIWENGFIPHFCLSLNFAPNYYVCDTWCISICTCCSHSAVSSSLWLREVKHVRLLCPSPSSWVFSNSCPLSQWCHPTLSSSVIPFSSCLQSFPASGSLTMSQFFASGGQSIGASASASVLPMNIQDWFPLGWTGLISLLSEGLSRVFSSTTVQKHQLFSPQPFFIVQLSHLYMTTSKNHMQMITTSTKQISQLSYYFHWVFGSNLRKYWEITMKMKVAIWVCLFAPSKFFTEKNMYFFFSFFSTRR